MAAAAKIRENALALPRYPASRIQRSHETEPSRP